MSHFFLVLHVHFCYGFTFWSLFLSTFEHFGQQLFSQVQGDFSYWFAFQLASLFCQLICFNMLSLERCFLLPINFCVCFTCLLSLPFLLPTLVIILPRRYRSHALPDILFQACWLKRRRRWNCLRSPVFRCHHPLIRFRESLHSANDNSKQMIRFCQLEFRTTIKISEHRRNRHTQRWLVKGIQVKRRCQLYFTGNLSGDIHDEGYSSREAKLG
jgi:hypothetical protein